MDRKILILFILAIITLGSFYYYHDLSKNDDFNDTQMELVKQYIENNISQISPQKEVLGGKFYITDLQLDNQGNGKVEYEDGHIALKASFIFDIKNGEPVINKFNIINSK